MGMNKHDNAVVYIIDDDAAVRDSVCCLLESVGLKAAAFAQAQDFLDLDSLHRPACLLLDMCLPDMDGLDVQQLLNAQGFDLPVIIMSGYGDVPAAVNAMKNGAVDLLAKPFNSQTLLDCVQNALLQDQSRHSSLDYKQQLQRRFATLTPREQEIMAKIVRGDTNKEIAEALGVSGKTVEVHRANVMKKMQTRSLAELIQIALDVGVLPDYLSKNQI